MTEAVYKLALIVRSDLKMPPGKVALHCVHATQCVLRKGPMENLVGWYRGKEVTVVLGADTDQAFFDVVNQADAGGLPVHVWMDSSKQSPTPSVAAVGPAADTLLRKACAGLKPL
jgi:PTH2 family peptidyl-tRNA hydrolase